MRKNQVVITCKGKMLEDEYANFQAAREMMHRINKIIKAMIINNKYII